MKWYEYQPSDTLFLRGAEPMVSGTSFETTRIFPPAVSVVSGAMRTAVLAQKRIPIGRYKNGDPVSEHIGDFGKKAPFNILGPFIRYRRSIFVPAPFTWFTENKNTDRMIRITEAGPLDAGIRNRLGLNASAPLIGWVRHRDAVKSVGGNWVLLDALLKGKTTYENGRDFFLPQGGNTRLFSVEERTGIAMDAARNVEESKIYTARHIRLNPHVTLVWGVDRPCGLAPEGTLSLGGEQRFGRYREIEKPFQLPESGTRYLALSPVPVTPETSRVLLASGKIIYRGGWNLARQFHKDMTGYYPAGAVFSANANGLCIPCV